MLGTGAQETSQRYLDALLSLQRPGTFGVNVTAQVHPLGPYRWSFDVDLVYTCHNESAHHSDLRKKLLRAAKIARVEPTITERFANWTAVQCPKA